MWTDEEIRTMQRAEFARAVGTLNLQISQADADMRRYDGKRGKAASQEKGRLLATKKHLLDRYATLGNLQRDAEAGR